MSSLLLYREQDGDELLGAENGWRYVRRGNVVLRVEGAVYCREYTTLREWPASSVARRIEERRQRAERDRAAVAAVHAVESRRGAHARQRRYDGREP